MAQRPETNEIATTRDGRDITLGYVDALPYLTPRDKLWLARGGWDAYEELLRDDQVAACFAQRRLAVISANWEVQPGGKSAVDRAAADYVTEQLLGIDLDRVTEQMLFGLIYGFAVAEALWTTDGGKVGLADIRVRSQRRFVFAPSGEIRLSTMRKPDGEPLPERKFWSYNCGAEHHDEPYGTGLGQKLYWPVWFKRNSTKFWLVFLEKFGQPTALGKFPAGTSNADQLKLLEAVQAIQTDSGIVIPDGMLVELVEAARSGTADYTALYDRTNGAIAKILLGQTMTTDQGSSLSQARVHMEVRQDIVKADADLICASFNRTIGTWLTEWNFPSAEPPVLRRIIEEEEDLNARAERDERLVGMGFRPTLAYVTETYGGEWTAAAAPAPPASDTAPGAVRQQVAFAQAATASRDAQSTEPELHPGSAITERLDMEAAPAIDELIGAIRSLVRRATSLDELRDALIDTYGDLPTKELAAVMQMAFAAAELAGQFDAQAETRAAAQV